MLDKETCPSHCHRWTRQKPRNHKSAWISDWEIEERNRLAVVRFATNEWWKAKKSVDSGYCWATWHEKKLGRKWKSSINYNDCKPNHCLISANRLVYVSRNASHELELSPTLSFHALFSICIISPCVSQNNQPFNIVLQDNFWAVVSILAGGLAYVQNIFVIKIIF